MGIPDESDSTASFSRGPQVTFTGDAPPPDWQTAAERYSRKQREQDRTNESTILISSDEEVPPLLQDAAGALTAFAASARSDDDTTRQLNNIRAEVIAQQPLVGELEPLSALEQEFQQSPVFLDKIRQLAGTYSGMRRVRGDGNCFYRAMLFCLLEGALLRSDKALLASVREAIVGWKEKLLANGSQEIVFEDAMEALLDIIDALSSSPPLSANGLLDKFRDETMSPYLIFLLRLIISCEIQRRAEHFSPFVMGMSDDGMMGVHDFCRGFVEPMGEESDHIQVIALTDALGVAVRIVYLDAHDSMGGGSNHHDFGVPERTPGGVTGPAEPTVVLLYRPGHYDILYPAAAVRV